MKWFISKILSREDQQLAEAHHITLIMKPSLTIHFHIKEDILQYLKDAWTKKKNVLVSSQNTIKSMRAHFPTPPSAWQFLTISGATQKALLDWGVLPAQIIHSGKNIAALLPFIKKGETYIHICGSHTMPDFYTHCSVNEIDHERCVVYQSTMNEEEVTEACDAYVFFSPRSVLAFLKKNHLDRSVTVLSIGHSTTDQLRKENFNNIIEAELPTFGSLLKSYFTL